MWVLNPQYGLVNAALSPLFGLFHHDAPGWLADPSWSKPGLILMDLWTAGGSMVIYLAGLQQVPVQLYEAAELDGASAWQRTRHVTLPQISPVIFYNLIMGVIGSFQYFTQSFVMTQGGPQNSTLFYALYLFLNAFRDFRMGRACAMAWVLFVLTMIATALAFRTSSRWVYYEGEARG
jgi:multiple sugar transport system permease protein